MWGPFALLSAALGLLALAVDIVGNFAGLGLGILAVVLGATAYRLRGGRVAWRLLGAGAVTLGVVAVLLAGAQITLTLIAIDRVANMLQP